MLGINKEIILLASSKKYNNYCVAGIDVGNGEWIRIVSDDKSICGAVRKEDMIYEDGASPDIFDIIKIQCKCHQTSHFQPENYIFDEKYAWRKIGTAKILQKKRSISFLMKTNAYIGILLKTYRRKKSILLL